MQYDTGPEVHPGSDITLDTADGSTHLGSATYDSDHDGIADSIILIDDGHEYVITDSDHDGSADSLREYDAAGREVQPDLGSSGQDVPAGADGAVHGLGALNDGAPTVDLDGDGTPDTVVSHLADGTVVGYSDTDGDGTADRMTQIAPDGRVLLAVPDGRGGWQQAATGSLDDDGRFVPDAAG